MKFNKGIKIEFSEKPLPEKMFAVVSESGTPEITGGSSDFKESYLMLFDTEMEAQKYIDKMNKESWFLARENKPVEINTTLKKFKSRYVPLQYAINRIYS